MLLAVLLAGPGFGVAGFELMVSGREAVARGGS
jgi:hypothetical protein